MRKLPILLGLLLLALVAYPFLRPGVDPPPLEQPDASDYLWANAVEVPTPPAVAYREEVLRDPVERAVSRLTWGTPELAHWTQTHLPDDRTRLVRRLVEELERSQGSASLGAARLLETLGLLASEEGSRVLVQYALSGPDYLQVPAIRALTACPWTDETEEALAELCTNASPQVRSAAQRALVERPGDLDPADIELFLQQFEGPEAHVVLDQVGRSGIASLADAVARHLDSAFLNTRQIAIRSLMLLDDPRGFAAGRDELRSPVDSRAFYALTIYRDVGAMPPVEALLPLMDHPDGDLRVTICEALGAAHPPEAEDREAAVRLLQRLAQDDDPVVRGAATRHLSSKGRSEQLQPWRKTLREGYGDALRSAVRLLCEQIRDPASAPLLRERLSTEADDPTDTAHLLFGLRWVGDPERDAPQYVRRMLRGGTEDDRRGGTQQTYLSEHASLYVQSLGRGVIPALLEGLRQAATPRAACLVLDALRGVSQGPDPRVSEALLALVRDESRSRPIRLAAADSLLFAFDPQLFDTLRALSDEVSDRAVAERLLRLCVCYF